MAALSNRPAALPLLDRQGVEELAQALDDLDALDAVSLRVRSAGGPPPAYVDLARRLALAGAQLAPATHPRPEFRDALRTRLVAVAGAQVESPAVARLKVVPAAAAPSHAPLHAPSRAPLHATPRHAAPGRARRRASWATVVTAGVTASVVALGGVAAASTQSLPGDPFYGVKRTAEAVRLATADSDLEEGQRHLEFAATRLRELRGLTLGRDAFRDSRSPLSAQELAGASTAALADPRVSERVRQTLADMDTETRKGTDLLTGVFLSSQAQAPLQALSRFTMRQSTGLERLLPALPRPNQDRAMASLALVVEVADETQDLMGTDCAPPCEPAVPAPEATATPSESPAAVEPSAGSEPIPTAVPVAPTLPDDDQEPLAPLEGTDPRPGTPSETPTPSSPTTTTPTEPLSPQPEPTPSSSATSGPRLPFFPLSNRVLGLAVADPLRTLRYLVAPLS